MPETKKPRTRDPRYPDYQPDDFITGYVEGLPKKDPPTAVIKPAKYYDGFTYCVFAAIPTLKKALRIDLNP